MIDSDMENVHRFQSGQWGTKFPVALKMPMAGFCIKIEHTAIHRSISMTEKLLTGVLISVKIFLKEKVLP